MSQSQKYVPPGRKNIKPKPYSLGVSIKLPNKVFNDFKNASLFPSLTNIKSPDNHSNMICFANVASGTEIVPREIPIYNPVNPGWVRLSRSQEGKFVQTFGDPIPKLDIFNHNEQHALLIHQNSVIKILERNEMWSFENGRDQYIHLCNLDYENSFYVDDYDEDYSSDGECSID